MRLNHINIPVDDVQCSKLFFERHFGFTCTEMKGDYALAVLKDNDGFTLVLMSQTFNRNDINSFPSAFHIGFLLETKEEVMAKYQELTNSPEITLENEPANMRGVFGFYFIAPGNVLVEVSSDAK